MSSAGSFNVICHRPGQAANRRSFDSSCPVAQKGHLHPMCCAWTGIPPPFWLVLCVLAIVDTILGHWVSRLPRLLTLVYVSPRHLKHSRRIYSQDRGNSIVLNWYRCSDYEAEDKFTWIVRRTSGGGVRISFWNEIRDSLSCTGPVDQLCMWSALISVLSNEHERAVMEQMLGAGLAEPSKLIESMNEPYLRSQLLFRLLNLLLSGNAIRVGQLGFFLCLCRCNYAARTLHRSGQEDLTQASYYTY
ncbi:uncharacterized protein F5Z01DRAFT_221149 [Emericellopsis atlantica]|uniref:Uncharacterized protein n=1 Tax=Emericellopsis atlantica TaxID=2614577 RepID=A0A9P7ZIG2_9HYPO|nr:uncharacterized protein F5Z01DRAFT_221149 [Emericellopsis atlantica]KAG9252625.1 hypothetical protein F5Z01DRAFT_221149 [Emericellopsis atlantica]